MKLVLSLAFATGLLLAGSASASAAMTAPPAPKAHAENVLEVRDGCGRDRYRNRWGRCVRDRDRDGWGDRDRDRDGCGRHHHRNRWGRCVRD